MIIGYIKECLFITRHLVHSLSETCSAIAIHRRLHRALAFMENQEPQNPDPAVVAEIVNAVNDVPAPQEQPQQEAPQQENGAEALEVII